MKRVIAGPGDWVYIDDDGNVFVNGEELDEPYLQEKALGDTDLEYPYQVPEKRWFVMGIIEVFLWIRERGRSVRSRKK